MEPLLVSGFGKLWKIAKLVTKQELTVMVLLSKTFLGTRKHIASMVLDGGHRKK